MFHIKSKASYNQQCELAISNPQEFWGKIADNFHWFKKYQKVIQKVL